MREQRSPRRRVQLRCSLRIAGREIDGLTKNLSASGLYLLVAPEVLSGSEIRDGRNVELRLDLQPGVTVHLRGEVAWTNSIDHDAAGRRMFGVGLRFIDARDDGLTRIARHLTDFRYTVVVASNNDIDRALLARTLRGEYEVIECTDTRDAIAVLASEEAGVLIADLPDTAQLLKLVTEKLPGSSVIPIVTAEFAEIEELHPELSKGRICHYLRKPLHPMDARFVVERAIAAYATAIEQDRVCAQLQEINERLQRENAYLRERTGDSTSFEGMIGNSPRLALALRDLERARHTDITVHIRGETGTGKELVARALHYGGPRAQHPFIAHNCGGMTETLLQSTLFGHKKGAFTGADRDQPGLFQEADKGTLFLDEIAELSPAMQAAMLRVLQEGEIMPVGATRPVKVDVRVVSATMKDLRDEVHAGRFRVDLYYRLVVMEIRLPPLRERDEDVPLLAQHFLEMYARRYAKRLTAFSAEAMEALRRHSWPGNVRELQNAIERAVVMSEDGKPISRQSLPINVTGETPVLVTASHEGDLVSELVDELLERGSGFVELMDALERDILSQVMARLSGNQSEAARRLKLARQTLQHRLRRLGLAASTSNVDLPRPIELKEPEAG